LAIGYYAGFMFTGLVEDIGSVIAVSTGNDGTELKIAAPRIAKKMHRGDSVAINGCCLTVSSRRGNTLHFHLLAETIACTNLGNLQRGDSVNLERALGATERLGGHFVQGHVDCVSRVVAFQKSGADFRLEIELPINVSRYVAPKGSIAVNGISLTVTEILSTSFVTWIIPFTKKHTNLDRAKPGDLMNLEFDILAKYLERMLSPLVVKK
jgi:riboflavin synthase